MQLEPKLKIGFKSTASRARETATNPLQNSHFENYEKVSNKREFISNLDDLNKQKPKKPKLIIPVQQNTINFSSKLEERAFKELTTTPSKRRFDEDAEAIKQEIIKTEADGDDYMSALQSEVQVGEEANYNAVPVESFGMGMLLGMGWEKHKGIGKTFKSVCKVKTPTIRPAGLGLGANLEDRGQQTLVAIGEKVKITEGKNAGKKGVITSMDVTNVRVTVLLKDGSKIDVSELCCKKLDKDADMHTEKEKKNKKEGSDRYKNDSQKIGAKIDRSGELKEYEQVNKPWLLPEIMVRVTDRHSPYFKEKFGVKSVLTPFVAMLENGKRVHQSQLDTVIPKEGYRCCILSGQYRNCLGRINKKNKKKGKVVLEFWNDDKGLEIKEFTFFEVTESTN